ncbi:hypothetical protein [Streptomyces sp. NPDC002785]|uniref:hypothetical protein n=1 Tax=Streptomyces sp. NPDC002785 TaxID=3154543 RepID=UPI0033236C26
MADTQGSASARLEIAADTDMPAGHNVLPVEKRGEITPSPPFPRPLDRCCGPVGTEGDVTDLEGGGLAEAHPGVVLLGPFHDARHVMPAMWGRYGA